MEDVAFAAEVQNRDAQFCVFLTDGVGFFGRNPGSEFQAVHTRNFGELLPQFVHIGGFAADNGVHGTFTTNVAYNGAGVDIGDADQALPLEVFLEGAICHLTAVALVKFPADQPGDLDVVALFVQVFYPVVSDVNAGHYE